MGDLTEVVNLKEQIRRCRVALDRLLPVEVQARANLLSLIGRLQLQRGYKNYPRVSLEPFRWRNKQGYPKLALFGIKGNGVFSISARTILLPGPLAECFDDVRRRLSSPWPRRFCFGFLLLCGISLAVLAIRILPQFDWVAINAIILSLFGFVLTCALNWKDLVIRARYEGIIPDEIKTNIEKVMGDFEGVYLMCEVPKWKLQKVVLPRYDPLVVGYRDGNLYLIDVFETTPTEEYIKQ